MNKLNVDCVNLIFENVGLKHRFYLARTLRINSLIDKAKRDTFRVKYGEFTLSEKEINLDEVIRKVRFNIINIPYALALRVGDGLLLFKFEGEVTRGELSFFEIDQINKKVSRILKEINESSNDFLPPATLVEQKNIIRRRYLFKILYNNYKRLYESTAANHQFPKIPLLDFYASNCPPIQVGSIGKFLIYGSYFWDNRYEFYIREGDSLKCSFKIRTKLFEISCFLPRISILEECHFVMIKVVAALFMREKQDLLMISHRINVIPLLYEVGLADFNSRTEALFKNASKQSKHVYEFLQIQPQVQEIEMKKTISKKGMNINMYDKAQRCLKEVFLNDSILADHT